MIRELHIDIETYSSVSIKTSGSYKYFESIDFEILMIAYAFDDNPIQIIDLALGEEIPKDFIDALLNPKIEKHAHNANFERNAFRTIGYNIPINQWYCSAVKSAYCGLPLSLDMVSEALELGGKGKLATGKALIRFFSVPIKPTKGNNFNYRNFPKDDIEKWDQFKEYCIGDVEAEREISTRLKEHDIPTFERENYILDQEINDRGILVDLDMAKNASMLYEKQTEKILTKLYVLTGLENPNSAAQLKEWLSSAMQKEITTLAKENIEALLIEAESATVKNVLELRKKSSKSSVKKYESMLACACEDSRVKGLFQFYGANRTGRWAGRLVQLQNLPQNHIKDLKQARDLIADGDFSKIELFFDDISNILSQLIRTAFVAKKGHTLAVADFSAIEARVIAWLADEKWRLDVFKSHGKIYEASASMMFNVPIEEVTKENGLRNKGKISELALGYQGALGALKKMGGEKMGLSDSEMIRIVKLWRHKNPAIVKLWYAVDAAAIQAVKTKKEVVLPAFRKLKFKSDGKVLTIELPSGRKLFYQSAAITTNEFGKEAVKYRGLDQITRKWIWIDSYGGKFVENIVQAIARDLLAFSMQEMRKVGFDIVMHVHDEVVTEVHESHAETMLETMYEIMSTEAPWALGLPLKAEGYITKFYKKD